MSVTITMFVLNSKRKSISSFQMERKFHSILQDIGRTLEKNAEERAEILQRISDNKITSDKKDRDIEKEIADVKNVQQELRSFQESFSCQVF